MFRGGPDSKYVWLWGPRVASVTYSFVFFGFVFTAFKSINSVLSSQADDGPAPRCPSHAPGLLLRTKLCRLLGRRSPAPPVAAHSAVSGQSPSAREPRTPARGPPRGKLLAPIYLWACRSEGPGLAEQRRPPLGRTVRPLALIWVTLGGVPEEEHSLMALMGTRPLMEACPQPALPRDPSLYRKRPRSPGTLGLPPMVAGPVSALPGRTEEPQARHLGDSAAVAAWPPAPATSPPTPGSFVPERDALCHRPLSSGRTVQ